MLPLWIYITKPGLSILVPLLPDEHQMLLVCIFKDVFKDVCIFKEAESPSDLFFFHR